MISIKSLITIVLLLAICLQNIECQNLNDLGDKPYSSLKQDREIRGLREVWEQVKNSAISSFNFLKKVAADTREKILEWAASARKYAVDVERSFVKQLTVLQKRLQDVVTDLFGTSAIVRECMRKEGKNIRDVLKEILKNMSKCISEQTNKLTQITGKHNNLTVDDTTFMKDLETKMEACESEQEHYEECLFEVRELIYADMEELDKDIQKTNFESRNIADNIRNTLATCSLQNLADASSYLTDEMMEIVRCVLDSRGINEGILE